jgi:ElaB/YqjD/DUF883 family membrane-anchored ribosome-binding protein
MKKTIIYFLALTSFFCSAQEISLDQLQVPTTPALTILDAGETNIETLTNTNAFSINNFNISSNAIEITPYWLKKDRILKGYEFYGLKAIENNGLKQNIFDGLKKFSVSVAFVDNDSLSNYSVGARVNLLKIRRKRSLDSVRIKHAEYVDVFVKTDKYAHEEAIKQIREEHKKLIKEANINLNDILFVPDNDLNEQELELKKAYYSLKKSLYSKNEEYVKAAKSYTELIENAIHSKPLLQVDIGAAYSFYNINQFSDIQTGRYGIWANVSSNLYHKNQFGIELSLHTRYLKDRLTTLNEEQDVIDLGGKLSLEINDNLTFSYEYIKRIKGLDDIRSVGEIKYRLFSDKNIYLSGGFGRNFMTSGNNTISLLGIKWGIANEAQKKGAEL